MIYRALFILLLVFGISCSRMERVNAARTEIAKWQDGKLAAISITYDGGNINQFCVAVPIMNDLCLPATFFIVTGDITGARYLGKFIGRPVDDILRESATIPISRDNFFERATAVRFLGYEEAPAYHTRAGDMFELGKFDEAYKHIEEAYAKARNGEFKSLKQKDALADNPTVDISWKELKELTARGYEFGSHSVSHPQPAICDDANLIYELEKSRGELINQLGPGHAFSAECPHGSENPRVMEFALKTYPALRNRMPEPFLEEINRWNKMDPASSAKEYVQWQRGPRTKTSLAEMKSWVDKCLAHDNFWLVLTFHGIDGIGYEPKTGAEIKDYFSYMKSLDDKIWIATFQDVTKYLRERMNANLLAWQEGETIKVRLTHSLDHALYNSALTLKTRVPSEWKSARIEQGDKTWHVRSMSDAQGSFVLYQALPNNDLVEIRKENP